MNIWDVCSFILGVITIIVVMVMIAIILFAVVVGVIRSYQKYFPKKEVSQMEFDIAAKKRSLYLHNDGLEAAFIDGANWSKRYHEGRTAR